MVVDINTFGTAVIEPFKILKLLQFQFYSILSIVPHA